MNITEMLDQLADYRAASNALNLRKQAEIDALLSEETKTKLREIDAEYAALEDRVSEQAAELEGKIRDEILSTGYTVRGTYLQAVWTKPRVTWDNAKLEGMMALIPQIKEARKEGKPSVTIRVV